MAFSAEIEGDHAQRCLCVAASEIAHMVAGEASLIYYDERSAIL